MRFLVTGAAGFIGSHLCDRLLADGHRVTGVDNLLTGRLHNLAHLQGHERFRWIEHDVTEPLSYDEALDGIYHLASPASPFDYLKYPIETLRVGSEGTRNLLETARAANCWFLLASTSESYGDPMVHPQEETYWGNVNPVGPRSCYDESKRFAEAITMAFHRQHGLRTNIARIFNTYGPRMKLNDGRIVPAFLSQALQGEPLTVFGSGTQTRSFCYVADLVDGLVRLGGCQEQYPVNLGNPAELTVAQFAECVLRLTGGTSNVVYCPLPEDDPQRRRPDISKARRLLGWEPQVNLEEGLRETILYFRARLDLIRLSAPATQSS